MTYFPEIEIGLMYEYSIYLGLCSLGHRRVDSSTEIRVMEASIRVIRADRTLGEMSSSFAYLGWAFFIK